MEDQFLTCFEKLSSLNISLYIREKDIIEAENVISSIRANTYTPNDNDNHKTLHSYTRLLKKLHKLQKKEKLEYAKYHRIFLGYVNECTPDILRMYAQELTKREHKFYEDIDKLEDTSDNPVELQRLKIVSKSYYDSIEAIYQYIDLKLQFASENKSLKKTTN